MVQVTYEDMLAALRDVVAALGPYRDDAVLAGGFVPLIYREARLFSQPRHLALLSGSRAVANVLFDADPKNAPTPEFVSRIVSQFRREVAL